jgi:hypothetical protein
VQRGTRRSKLNAPRPHYRDTKMFHNTILLCTRHNNTAPTLWLQLTYQLQNSYSSCSFDVLTLKAKTLFSNSQSLPFIYAIPQYLLTRVLPKDRNFRLVSTNCFTEPCSRNYQTRNLLHVFIPCVHHNCFPFHK